MTHVTHVKWISHISTPLQHFKNSSFVTTLVFSWLQNVDDDGVQLVLNFPFPICNLVLKFQIAIKICFCDWASISVPWLDNRLLYRCIV